jgi:hypothetical protein
MSTENSSDDLWPSADELTAEPQDRPPLNILRKQAARLGEKTKNVVEAKVSAEPLPGTSKLRLELSLVAPALGGYEYILLRAQQPADLYPVELEFEGKFWTASDERGFKEYLANLFKSAHTRKIIGSMLVQSRGA